jgi:entericidin B
MRDVTQKRWLMPVLIALSVFAAAACNTVAGAGKDITATGDAVTDTAEDAQDNK